MENETKVVKFEIGKLLAVVITVVTVAVVATIVLNSSYFKGSTIDAYLDRVETTNTATTVNPNLTETTTTTTETATVNPNLTETTTTTTETATVNPNLTETTITNTETATVNPDLNPNIDNSVKCAVGLTYNEATDQCCTQPDASGAVVCS